MRPFALAATLALSLAVPLAAQTPDPARSPVQALSDGLIATMKAGAKAGVRGREATIGPIVDRSFDLPLMTRLVVGSGWTALPTTDQTALLAAFRRLTVAQYAASFDSWNGERIAVDPKVEIRGDDRLVRTTLTGADGKPVAIAYRLRRSGSQSGGGWRIIDVFYRDAISQLATRRADFARVLQTGGAKALAAHLDALASKAEG